MSSVSASEPKLRFATVNDLETILRHRRDMFREMGGKYRETLNQFEDASRRYFERALQIGTYSGLFIEIDSVVVAGGGVLIAEWPGSPLNLGPRRAWILNIYVEPPHRRQGYARTIARHLVNWCRENGFLSVSLHASERGRKLYDVLGFRPTNEMRLIL